MRRLALILLTLLSTLAMMGGTPAWAESCCCGTEQNQCDAPASPPTGEGAASLGSQLTAKARAWWSVVQLQAGQPKLALSLCEPAADDSCPCLKPKEPGSSHHVAGLLQLEAFRPIERLEIVLDPPRLPRAVAQRPPTPLPPPLPPPSESDGWAHAQHPLPPPFPG